MTVKEEEKAAPTAAAAPTTTTSSAASDYFVSVTIGQGSFGTVLYGKHKWTGQPVAIKVMDKHSLRQNPCQLASTLQEQRLLRRLNHTTNQQQQQQQQQAYTVQLLASFHDDECVYMVLECCLGGDLAHVIRHQQQQQQKNSATIQGNDDDDWELRAAHIGWELMRAIQSIHERQVVHADLSPANVVFTSQGRLRLIDFGSALDFSLQSSSNRLRDEESSSAGVCAPLILQGSSAYASPEVIQARYEELSPAIDLWSYGCILAALWTGDSPFRAATEALTVERVLDYAAAHHCFRHPAAVDDSDVAAAVRLQEILPSHIPKTWRDLALALLNPAPGMRPAAVGDFSAIQLAWEAIIGGKEAPSFDMVEPEWLLKSKHETMRDGSIGWSAFMID